MKHYKVKEIYYTIQGEGHHTGRAAVFCRFAGCNLWSGREEDRNDAICKFCDTDFWGMDGDNGGRYTSVELALKIKSLFPQGQDCFVVCTGGEPALQMDDELVSEFKNHSIEVAIETNGTLDLPRGIDWICVSPKSDTEIIITKGNELKLVFPQKENTPELYQNLDFEHFYLQPLDDENQMENTRKCIQFCKENPEWKLSMQTHKYLNIP